VCLCVALLDPSQYISSIDLSLSLSLCPLLAILSRARAVPTFKERDDAPCPMMEIERVATRHKTTTHPPLDRPN